MPHTYQVGDRVRSVRGYLTSLPRPCYSLQCMIPQMMAHDVSGRSPARESAIEARDFCSSPCGSLAMFTAMRHASSRVGLIARQAVRRGDYVGNWGKSRSARLALETMLMTRSGPLRELLHRLGIDLEGL
jgi:hypothetical protein